MSKLSIPRRRFLQLAAGVTTLPLTGRFASADSYPNKPVHVIVGFSAGSASDINARMIGQWLSEPLGQPFVIENRSGAGGNIATEYVVRAQPDGYTLLYASTAIAINNTLYEGKVGFDSTRDLAPVAGVVRTPIVMEVNGKLPVKTVPEFIAYAKANRGKINVATVGAGSLQHLCGEYFNMVTRLDMVPVHYRGAAPAITDLIAGRVQVMFDVMVSSISYIKGGKLRALAVSPTVQEQLPGVPTMAESVEGFEAGGWQGFCAPSNTPPGIIEKLNREVNLVLANDTARTRLTDLGGQPFPGPPDAFGTFIAHETEKWGKVVRKADLKPG
jgi:tripartite-type tricarboxylate transporter receptor subunit TctC